MKVDNRHTEKISTFEQKKTAQGIVKIEEIYTVEEMKGEESRKEEVREIDRKQILKNLSVSHNFNDSCRCDFV